MRRTYYVDLKKKKATDDAMAQWRRTRDAIDPALLEDIRRLIAGAAMESSPASAYAQAREPVDRKKNLSTIMKFLQLTANRKDMHRQVQALLPDTLH